MKQTDTKLTVAISVSSLVTVLGPFFILMLLHATGARAQEAVDETSRTALEEIIVTAAKREQSLLDVAASVSVLDQESLERMRLEGLKDAQRFLPSLSLTEFGFAVRNGPNITIRGVSNTRLTRSTDNIAALTTAFFIDDIAVTPVDTKFIDVARVEVLNGPQGTLWGAASMGGTVRVILNKPDPSEFSAKIGFGAFATNNGAPSANFDGMVNIPIIDDKLAVRLTAYNRDEGGYIDVRDPGLSADRVRGDLDLPGANLEDIQLAQSQNVRKDANDAQTFGARISARLIASENLELEGTLFFQDRELSDSPFIHRNLKTSYYRESFLPDPRDEEFFLASLTARYQTRFAEFVSVSGYYDRDFEWMQDVTQLISTVYGTTPDGGIPARSGIAFRRGESSFSQELRLQSTAGESSRFDWVVGAYYFSEDRFSDTMWLAPGFNENVDPAFGIPNSQDLVAATDSGGDYENLSFFGDVTFRFTDRLSIAVGARHYDQELDESRTDFGPIQGVAEGEANVRPFTSTSSDGFTPRVSVSYQLSSDSMVYALASEGFRLGGDNNNPVLETNPACIAAADSIGLGGNLDQFDSDELLNYEVGTKTTWGDNRYFLSAAGFYIDWSDLQQSVSLTQFNSLCPTSITANIGSASIKGAEVVFVGQFTDQLEIGATVSLNEAEFDAPPQGTTLFREGQAIPQVPKWKFSTTAQYDFPVMGRNGFIRGEFSYNDSFTTNGFDPENPNPFFQVGSSSVLNFRAGVDFGAWSGVIFAENVTDEEIVTGAQIQAGEGFSNQAFVARPRTVGFSVQRRF